ncbi:sphingomyelin phosphodiesterase [Chitinimonas lacunae]|uniref:Sphingomyelin phosphodiesterase n=1 Tax=Chitinimonas lacunae TaxID=1963018 RepID=A0ABV8MSF0_9NEIS
MRITRWLAALAAAVTAFAVQAETYIFVTNDTPRPVQVAVAQSGDKPLVEGTHWGRYTDEIPAYATRKVLWMNRDEGITNGKHFWFETTLRQGDGAVVLQQQLRGKLIGSSIWHSARSADFAHGWWSDREIHNGHTRFGGQLSLVSYRAQATGGFDDFHYVIQQAPARETASTDNELKILAWNIWGVIGAKQICDRWAEVPARAVNYDVLVFSEAFDNGCRDRLRAALAPQFPYQSQIVDKANIYEDGGVFIASRWPISSEHQTVYSQCAGTDCLANKGAMLVEVIKHGRPYHIVGTHTQAWNGSSQRAVRLSQLDTMKRFVDGFALPDSEPLFYAGDLNVDRFATADDYAEMLRLLNAEHPAVSGPRYTYDPELNALASPDREFLDYVLVARHHRRPQLSSNEVMVYRSLAPAVWGLRELSDHFALAGRFRF